MPDTTTEAVTTWPPTSRSIPAVRRSTQAAVAAWRLLGVADAAALVVTELATNAVEHARTPFTVSLTRLPGALLIQVDDGARPFAVDIDQASADSDGGRGMHMVGDLAEGWGVAADDLGGKAVWALLLVDVDDLATAPVPVARPAGTTGGEAVAGAGDSRAPPHPVGP